MATFVLVHGAWAGGWCWNRVAPRLRAGGHAVFTPTLTGLGERAHLARPDVGFETHVQDVVNVLEYEDLRDVVLVGHSLGGTVVGAVAHRAPERISRLIFLDAIVPADGRSVLELFEDYGAIDVARHFRDSVTELGEGWLLPVPDAGGSELEGLSPKEIAWVEQRERPHPAGAVTMTIHLGNPAADRIPRTYIACTRRSSDSVIHSIAERVRVDPRWRYLELDAVHDANLTAPEELTRLFIEIASEG